ncbi:hypothetical protein FSP39_004022, partial [Pinctada imbricata]
ASLYAPKADKQFSCIDGSRKIPYEHLNDDYCDCPDGSDEPGTSACPQATFHCTNAGYLPKDIRSSRVNDGVCDCCDGTDEYSGNIECVNNCKDLGKKLREEREEKRRLQEAGHKKKAEFSEQGKKTKEEKKNKIQDLEKEKQEIEEQLKDLEARKSEAEGPEKEAKEKFEKAWEETKAQKQAEKDKINAKEAFEDLDANKDGMIDVHEMLARPEFDIDSDGKVSEEEAKEHLEETEQASYDHFMEKMWPNIKTIYKKPTPVPPQTEEEPKGESEEPSPPTPAPDSKGVDSSPPPPIDVGEDDDDDDDHDEDDHDDEDEDDFEDRYKETTNDAVLDSESETTTPPPDSTSTPSPDSLTTPTSDSTTTPTSDLVAPLPDIVTPPKKEDEASNTEDEDKMPDYDDDIKALINAADEARKNFNDAETKKKDIDREVSDLTSYLNTDFGPEEEFAVLKENCFEYTDREYTYKLCPFSSASQRSKNGGGETSLGSWGKWDGPSDNIYSIQKYENGQNCWNGPNRSVKVHLKCGQDHQLTNAYEPSRCEYAFDFTTPCICATPSADDKSPDHDEL